MNYKLRIRNSALSVRLALWALLFLVGFLSCINSSNEASSTSDNEYVKINNSYAKGFEIFEGEDHFKVVFYNLEDNRFPPSKCYFHKGNASEIKLAEDAKIFPIPFGNIALESTTHASYILKLGLEENIKGIAYAQFVQDSILKSSISDGAISNISAAEGLDIEKLLSIDIQALTISPFSVGSMDKYSSVGIPVIVISEYLERHPLATAEWIKLFGLMYGKFDEANKIFEGVEERYNSLKQTARVSSYTPSVIIGSEYNGQWSMPGGESNIATMISDAGGQYLFPDYAGINNRQIDIEVLLHGAADVDYWGKIGSGSMGEHEFGNADSKLLAIKAAREGRLFYCNAKESDYFVKACTEPDKVLADLIGIFQPSLNLGYENKYFKNVSR